MTSRPNEQQIEDATAWLLRLSEADDTGLQQRHRAWLALDPAHEIAWRQVSKGWSLIGQAGAASRETAPREASANVYRLPQRRAARMRWIGLAAAACLLLALLPVLQQRLTADYATATAERRDITLADGSMVRMGAETAVAVDLDSSARAVKLLRGHAFFEVARDEARPFTVQAGDVTVAVLGTAFDVNLTETAVTVAVRHGVVGVRAGSRSDRVDERLLPGDQLTISRKTGAAVASRLRPEDVAGWIDGKLFVVNMALSDAVAELRRYRQGWIVIADDALGASTVTGLYNLQSPDAALQAMLHPVGGTVRQVTPFLAIVSKADTKAP